MDDDPAEIERVRKYLGDRFVIGAGQSVQQALDDLRSRGDAKPDLYILDMYFSEGRPLTVADHSTLQTAREKLLKAQAEFQAVLARMGQASEGGFRLARDLRKRTRRGFVFFTRKGGLNDAITAYEELRAVSVIHKPDPAVYDIQTLGLAAAYDKAFEDKAGLIAGKIERAIRSTSWWGRHSTDVYAFILGVVSGLAATAIWEAVRLWVRR